MTNQIKAYGCAALTILAWSTVSTAFKLSLQNMTPMQLIYISMMVATVFLGAVLLVQRSFSGLKRFSASDWGHVLLLGVLLYSYYTLLFMSYDRLPAQITQPINNTWAIMLTLFATWLFKQKLSLRELLCMLVAYSGVVIIATGGGGTWAPLNYFGLLCVMGSTVLYALYWILNMYCKLPATLGLFCSFAVAGFLAALSLVLTGQSLLVHGFWPGVYVGLFELAIPFVLWGMALQLSTKVSHVATLPFLVPFLSLFWISLILKEPIAWSTVVGMCFIVVGTFLQQQAAAQKKQENASAKKL